MRYEQVSTVRQSLSDLIEDLGESVAITKAGKPVAVLLSFEEFRALRATRALLDQPDLVRQMYEDKELLRQRGATAFEEIGEALERRRRQGQQAPRGRQQALGRKAREVG